MLHIFPSSYQPKTQKFYILGHQDLTLFFTFAISSEMMRNLFDMLFPSPSRLFQMKLHTLLTRPTLGERA